jgi:hypothetical protein
VPLDLAATGSPTPSISGRCLPRVRGFRLGAAAGCRRRRRPEEAGSGGGEGGGRRRAELASKAGKGPPWLASTVGVGGRSSHPPRRAALPSRRTPSASGSDSLALATSARAFRLPPPIMIFAGLAASSHAVAGPRRSAAEPHHRPAREEKPTARSTTHDLDLAA